MIDPPSEIAKLLPGAIGAAVSTIFMNQETWPRKIGMACAGMAAARFGGAWASSWTGLDASFTGFLLGLFSMAIVAGIFETWRAMQFGPLVTEWLRKVLGLPPKE
jgi:hypothetical protein